ncbi:DNA polymerase IV [Cellulomonas marina]|uniref:DNA polymerase IV n=1 Tax=Cellulomonas marina TaxID=988821 RepID=UPI0023B33C9A|nr:DNA polymerase IV [Cellulomonas marina]
MPVAPRLRDRPSILHMDADAFFASVEQLQKPSLAGKPVLVGGVGGRGVVAAASYEARAYGVRSAMPMARARRLCPTAAVLVPRFDAYSAFSAVLMGVLREHATRVQPLSIDEAFADLDAGPVEGEDGAPALVRPPVDLRATAEHVRAEVARRCGLPVTIGMARSKLVAKLASDAAKPAGLLVVPPEDEDGFLLPLPVRALWGVGPATAAALDRVGVRTVADLRAQRLDVLVELTGQAQGTLLHAMARGWDDRPVEVTREVKSVGAERTFAADVVGRAEVRGALERVLPAALGRLHRSGAAARTVVVKVRLADFTTLTRSTTLPHPTSDEGPLRTAALAALEAAEVAAPVRLLGVSFHGLSEHAQLTLALDEEPTGEGATTGMSSDDEEPDGADEASAPTADGPVLATPHNTSPGMDVEHPEHGRGWVVAVRPRHIAVRFETAATGRGPQRVLPVPDEPLWLVGALGPDGQPAQQAR